MAESRYRHVAVKVDGRTAAIWRAAAGKAAEQVQGRPLRQWQEHGVELHPNDLQEAEALAREWQWPTPEARIYRPQEGLAFLIAVWATYHRGSRFMAEVG